ncbi:FxsA family protein [Rubellimicrobium roseum]|nr:FxsA family protein [Rubellimicrobium roseum]
MARLLLPLLVLGEIAGFVLVGRAVGVLGTLALVVLATALGVWLLKRQGAEAMASMRGTLQTGRDPRPALRRGGFGLVAALLLILPGFLSDVVAILLLLPPVQQAIARRFAARGVRIVTMGRSQGFGPAAPPRPEAPRDRVIDAEWEDVAMPKNPTHRPSGWTRH